MKFKSATLTWFNGNYGSILQAYALQQNLLGLGIDNEIINYVPDNIEKARFFLRSSARNILIKNKLDSRKIQNSYFSSSEIDAKRELFLKFKNEHLKLTKVFPSQKSLYQISSSYDVYLCGSDQIWNPNYFKKCNYLDFVDMRKRKIAYAPSIGTISLTQREKYRIKPLLNEIDYISLREKSGAELIGSLVDSPVSTVCDPVFLLTKNEWISSLGLEMKKKDRYILCYFLGENDEYLKTAEFLSDETNIPIKSIPTNMWGYENCKGNIKVLGPIEWIDLIANADFILTDSFHATALAIIFNVNFFSFKRFHDTKKGSQNSRIFHILTVTDLLDRIVAGYISNQELEITANRWDNANSQISEYRNYSINWLKNALQGYI